MPKIKVLPHAEICPQGAEFEAESGISVCENLLNQDIDLEHACELSCACTTCHVIFTKGFSSLNDSSDDEEDLLDKAWGLEPKSRLSCQTLVEDTDLEIQIPRYTINMVSENHPKPSKDSNKGISSKDFDISNTAASHLTEMINANNSLGIRISLKDSGCSGFAYQLDLIDEKDKNDLAGLVNGVNLFIHDKSFVFLKGTKLDFVKKNLNQELVFLNPNVSAECGCGESFNFDNELVKELSNN
jgi:2Fe-2S ferredoxin